MRVEFKLDQFWINHDTYYWDLWVDGRYVHYYWQQRDGQYYIYGPDINGRVYASQSEAEAVIVAQYTLSLGEENET
jgi:hypothetical protein